MSRMSDALKIPELGEHDRDYKPVSSPDTLKKFLESSLYTDFQKELDTRITDLRDFLEVNQSNKYYAAQGAVAFARLVKGIFENLLLNRLADLEHTEDKESKEIEDE